MKFLFDLFPIILFFVAFKYADIYTATIVAMVATIGQILWVYYRHRKIDAMQWVSLVMILVFGSLTIFLHDKTFIQLKPTALYWLFAAALFISAQFFNKNWIQVLMGKQITLKEPRSQSIWHQVNMAWSVFFLLMGALNLYIAFEFSEETWVNFKLFGSTGLLIFFVILQGVWLSRHMEETPE
ncbi:septation protein A [Polynucleobacter antarcticus]|uniref:Inner membrane-spanning protein YciB n=1 Tax=Polynucleobacter antarcticus TaxID=1743162 RepID=A0A6M9PUJ3_9BURK|nr:septation protein A [Polynucleobacter antarcticus]QKM62557.1 septation protein A [Polynucleobacter antarcticus]